MILLNASRWLKSTQYNINALIELMMQNTVFFSNSHVFVINAW
jgi:hypothetical protein